MFTNILVSPGPPIGSALDNLAILAVGVALAAGTAALSIRSWGRGWPAAAVGALIFGLVPAIVSVLDGPLTPLLIALVPAVFAVATEMLVRKRVPFWLLGAACGLMAALEPLRAPGVILAVLIAASIALIALALLHPPASALGVGHAMRTLIVAVPVFLVGMAYPLLVRIDSPTSMSIQLGDNHSGLGESLSTIVTWVQSQVATRGVAVWLAGAVALAFVITRLRRARAL